MTGEEVTTQNMIRDTGQEHILSPPSCIPQASVPVLSNHRVDLPRISQVSLKVENNPKRSCIPFPSTIGKMMGCGGVGTY